MSQRSGLGGVLKNMGVVVWIRTGDDELVVVLRDLLEGLSRLGCCRCYDGDREPEVQLISKEAYKEELS